MMWGGVSEHYKCHSIVVLEGNITARRYVDEVLRHVVLPFMAAHNADTSIFQQDNARPHAARLTQDFLRENGLNVMPWPAYSPRHVSH